MSKKKIGLVPKLIIGIIAGILILSLIHILNKYQNINIKTIVPSEYLGGSLNKDKDNVQKNINLGYLDAMKAYDRYEGIKYYFNVDYMFCLLYTSRCV